MKNKFLLLGIFMIFFLASCEDQLISKFTDATDVLPVEITTRSNPRISSFTGDKNLEVGLRKTYKIIFSSPLPKNMTFTVLSSNTSAVRFSRINENIYYRHNELKLTLPANTLEAQFDVLPIKDADNITITFDTQEANICATITNIKITKPALQFEIPNQIYTNNGFNLKIKHSGSIFNDREVIYNYQSTFLSLGGTASTNTGFNTYFETKSNTGRTTIKATIRGKINSSEFYEIGYGEISIEIIKGQVEPSEPDPGIETPPGMYIDGLNELNVLDRTRFNLIYTGKEPKFLQWYVDGVMVARWDQKHINFSFRTAGTHEVECRGSIFYTATRSKKFIIKKTIKVYDYPTWTGTEYVEIDKAYTFTLNNLAPGRKVRWSCNKTQLISSNNNSATFKFTQDGLTSVTAKIYDDSPLYEERTLKYYVSIKTKDSYNVDIDMQLDSDANSAYYCSVSLKNPGGLYPAYWDYQDWYFSKGNPLKRRIYLTNGVYELRVSLIPEMDPGLFYIRGDGKLTIRADKNGNIYHITYQCGSDTQNIII